VPFFPCQGTRQLLALSCLLGMIATIVCLLAWRGLRGTTFAAPAAWAVFSFAALTIDAGYSWIRFRGSLPAAAHADYLAGMTTLAPFVALLGAKRPQDRPWQLIVASLLGLLAFQDLRSWSIDPSVPPAPHATWCWLIAGLVFMQLLNYLPTRYAPAACIAFAGQVCLLSVCFPFLPDDTHPASFGLLLLAVSTFLATALTRRRTFGRREPEDGLPGPSGERTDGPGRPSSENGTRRRPVGEGWQQSWLDFRNTYGVLWSLRVAERVNAMSAQKCRAKLTWQGVQAADEPEVGTLAAGEAEPVHQALKAILLRFVSHEWLRARHTLRVAGQVGTRP